MEENEFIVLNGRTPGDYEGQFTYILKKKKSTNDLVWVNLSAVSEIKNFEICQLVTKSDHFPIFITLRKKEKSIQSINKVRWKSDLSNEFSEAMNSLLCEAMTNLHNVDLLADELISSITLKAKSIGMTLKINNKTGHSKAWYDSECVSLKKHLKKLLKKCKKEKFDNDETIVEYNNSKKIYHNLKKLKKETHRNSILDQLTQSKDSKTFWRIINSFRRSYNNAKNDIELDVWYEYFSTFFQEIKSHKENTIVEISIKHSNLALEKPITKEEIISALRNSKNNKTPGSDEISFEFLKNLPENWIHYVTLLFNQILNVEKVPESWSKIILKMIYKSGDSSRPENYRPIALVNSVTKIFTCVVTNRIVQWAKKENLLPEFQSGFRKHRSCIDNIFVLNALVQSRVDTKGGRLYALFVDFSNAFPSISHNLLWEKLYKLGVGYKLIRIFMDFY